MDIREVSEGDLVGLLELYQQLHNNNMPEQDQGLALLWRKILDDKSHHIIVGTVEGRIVSSCVLVIIRNLTHNQKPYALIENVITDAHHRNKGYASKVLDYAKEIALKESCYKIMLMTGSKLESTLTFYEKAGYNRMEKTAFIQRL